MYNQPSTEYLEMLKEVNRLRKLEIRVESSLEKGIRRPKFQMQFINEKAQSQQEKEMLPN